MALQRILLCVSFIVVLVSGLPAAFAADNPLEQARQLYGERDLQAAYKQIYQIPLGDLDPKRMALIQLFRGILSYEMKKYPQAMTELDRSIKLGTRLRDVSHFYRGLTAMATKNFSAARTEFNAVKDWDASIYLNNQAQFHLAQIALLEKQYGVAETILLKLERDMRQEDVYPEIVYSLMTLAIDKKNNSQTCRWAKTLYKNYPTLAQVNNWGLQWSQNKIAGRRVPCDDNLHDRKARIRRLQWLGASEKAFAELQLLQKSNEKQFDKDEIMANYLINEGHVTEALAKLLPYYPKKSGDNKFTMLLAKAAERAGEFQMAIGLFTRAAKTTDAAESRTALFRGAFLSYQHQDYDAALGLFQQLKAKHPNSSLTQEANWYIPWLYYLKGNYQVAHDLFAWAADKKDLRLPRRMENDQISYWRAMCLSKLGNNSEAEKILSEIAQDEFIGYYSVAAVQRLKGLAGQRSLAVVENNSTITVHENWLPNPEIPNRSPAGVNGVFLERNNESYFTEWQNLPFMQEYLQLGDAAEMYAQVEEPELRYHIERAKDMSIIGLENLAKWELYSVEQRTVNKDYLKTLMFEYHRNGIYHRSSYLGTRHFANTLSHLGLHLGASLWQFVYPRAFENYVTENADRLNIPAEFIWSIMKAETNFRADAVSPVGAKGLMQVMTHTGRKVAGLIGQPEVESLDLIMPHVNIQIGSHYLHRLLKKFQNKIPLAAAAYNGGPHRVHAWLSQFGHLEMDEFIEHIPFQETRNYVKKVARYYAIYNLLYKKDNEASAWLADLVDVQLDGSPPTRETWEVL